MKHLYSFCLLLAMAQSLNAQSGRGQANGAGQWAFRVNPLGLVDIFDGNLSVGMEHFINSRLSLTADISAVLYSAYLPKNKRAFGYNIKPSIRYYMTTERKFFLETTVFYKRVGYKIEDWLGKDCTNGVPAYEEFREFIYRKRVVGLNAQAGFRRNLNKSKLLFMELYAGLGIRFKWQDIKNDPRACYQNNNLFFDEFNERYSTGASVPHGLRLVYIIQ